MTALLAWLYEFSGAAVYYGHAICLTNDPVIMTFYVAGDLTIWASYLVIGALLLARPAAVIETIGGSTTWLYGAFIALCGFSHLSKMLTLFAGIYRLDVVVVLATASVSALTAWRTAVGAWPRGEMNEWISKS